MGCWKFFEGDPALHRMCDAEMYVLRGWDDSLKQIHKDVATRAQFKLLTCCFHAGPIYYACVKGADDGMCEYRVGFRLLCGFKSNEL